MNKKSPQWPQILSAYYGATLSTDEANLWHAEMSDMKPANADICEAIRMARNAGMKPDEWKATVTDLRRWLKIYRSEQEIKKERQEFDRELPKFIAKWKAEIKNGADPDSLFIALEQMRVPEREWPAVIEKIRGDES